MSDLTLKELDRIGMPFQIMAGIYHARSEYRKDLKASLMFR